MNSSVICFRRAFSSKGVSEYVVQKFRLKHLENSGDPDQTQHYFANTPFVAPSIKWVSTFMPSITISSQRKLLVCLLHVISHFCRGDQTA